MKNKGFTLVELLVVIVIIGVLAAISIGTFQGYQDQVRLATAQASSAQIKRQFLAKNASVQETVFTSWYSFDGDDVGATTVADRGEANNTLIQSGAGTIAASTDTGLGIGKSLETNNSLMFVDASSTGLANRPINSLTFAFWFKTDRTAVYPIYIGSTVAFQVLPDRSIKFDMGAFEAFSPEQSIKPNNWHYVIGSYGNGQLQLWLDGRLVDTVQGASVGTWPNSDLVLGGFPATAGSFFIDEVMIMPYAFDGDKLHSY